MKLTKSQLQRIIKEELTKVVEGEAHNPLNARRAMMSDLGAEEATLGAIPPEEQQMIVLKTPEQVEQAKALQGTFDWFVQEFTPEQQEANGWPIAVIRYDYREM